MIEDDKEQVLECLQASDIVFLNNNVAMACAQHMQEELGMTQDNVKIIDIAKVISEY